MFITRAELKLYFNRSTIISTIILALLSLIVGLLGDKLLYKDKLVPIFTIYLVDNDKSVESMLLLHSLKNFKADTMDVYIEEDERARAAVSSGEAAAALILPANFFADIMSGENSNAELLLNNDNPAVSEIIKLFSNSIKEQLSASQSGIYSVISYADTKTYQKYMNESNVEFMSVFAGRNMDFEIVSPFRAVSKADYFCFCFYLFIMFLISCLFIEKGNIIKSGELTAVLLSKGVKEAYVWFYKFTSVLIVYTILNIPIFAAMTLGGIMSSINFLGLLLLFTIITLCQSALSCLFIWLFNDIKSAGIFIFIFHLSMFFFSGGILPLVFLPKTIGKLCALTPNYYLTNLFISLRMRSIDTISCIIAIIFIAAVLAGSYYLAIGTLRKAREL